MGQAKENISVNEAKVFFGTNEGAAMRLLLCHSLVLSVLDATV